ncbi:MAG: TPM domain-containing protein, partial [Proteobacteria bacterium]|nr:TPM domain-containing protein [Pseudomonadota bacterium]
DFSLRVAKANGIGYKGYDNGILITLAVKEKKVRIELGKGMEPYISNSTAKMIIVTKMTPYFAKDDFATGLENGLNQLMEKAREFVIKDELLLKK